ncbi:MAG: hypothetical protein Q9184_001004 [Pyrenodesmia sp. 2 TL-2023]
MTATKTFQVFDVDYYSILTEDTDFKSYKGHHVLQIGDSYFTSVIGPNGSGKSNSYAM